MIFSKHSIASSLCRGSPLYNRYFKLLNIGSGLSARESNRLNNVGGRNVALIFSSLRISIISSGLWGGGAIFKVAPVTSMLIANDRPAPKKRGVSNAK